MTVMMVVVVMRMMATMKMVVMMIIMITIKAMMKMVLDIKDAFDDIKDTLDDINDTLDDFKAKDEVKRYRARGAVAKRTVGPNALSEDLEARPPKESCGDASLNDVGAAHRRHVRLLQYRHHEGSSHGHSQVHSAVQEGRH